MRLKTQPFILSFIGHVNTKMPAVTFLEKVAGVHNITALIKIQERFRESLAG